MRWSHEQNAGTGCRVAGEGASIFVESLDEGCQIFTYSEPGCVRILALIVPLLRHLTLTATTTER
jgi:hypothetical protein